jgi:hypothetical protein
MLLPVGNKHHLFGTGFGQVGDIGFQVVQGAANVRIGLQGVQKQHTPDDGFHIPYAFDTTGHFGAGAPGEGNKMKGIAYPQKFP